MADVPLGKGMDASSGRAVQEDEDGDDTGSRIGTKTFDVVVVKGPNSVSDKSSPAYAGDDTGSRIGTKTFDVAVIKDPKSVSDKSSPAYAGDEVNDGDQDVDAGGISGANSTCVAKQHVPEKTEEHTTTKSISGAAVPDSSTAARENSAGAESVGANAAVSDQRAAKVPDVAAEEKKNGPATLSVQAWDDFDPDECFICFDGGEILLCDFCDRSYHLQCHRPPLDKIPEGEFKCMECVAMSKWGISSASSTPGSGTSDKGKKRAQKDDAPESVDPLEAVKYIGSRVAKRFDGEVYFGSITQYNEKTQFWHVVYDDNDEEDYDPNDMEEAGILYRKERKSDGPDKTRGSQQRYFRRNKVGKAPRPQKKKKKVEKSKPSRSNASRPRSQSPVVEKLPPKYCVIQVPKEARPGDIIDVVFPGDEFTSQVVCPKFVQRSPFMTVVAPGGYQPPSAPMDYARANTDRLCAGLPTNKTRPFVVEAFNCTLWPALKANGWKRVDVLETGTGSIQYIPPGNHYTLSDSAGRLGLGFCTSYHGVLSFCADKEEYKEHYAAFEADCIARQEKAERLEQMKRDTHYLSSKQHDTPIGPDHQVSNLPYLRRKGEYLSENRDRLRMERCCISWSPKFVNIATNNFLEALSTQNRAEYDLEAAMEIFWSYDYNDIAARAVITMPVPPDESWKIGVDEKEFEDKLKASNHDLKKVADALGVNLIKCLWYYYHCFRPCRQWDFQRDKDAFHYALLEARGDLRKAATILGRRYDSCLWFYDSKYRFSPLHQEFKAAEKRFSEEEERCASCQGAGDDLLPCSECSKSYHTSCLFLEEAESVEGEWICPDCRPGFSCPNCSKGFRKESGLNNHLRYCTALPLTDSDGSIKDQEENDDKSAHANSFVQEQTPVPSALVKITAPVVSNPPTRPPDQFPIPPVISSFARSNNLKEVEAIDPATMTRLRLFPSVNHAARMSTINRTILAKVCNEGGGVIEGIFYRFTSDGSNPAESNQSGPRTLSIRQHRARGDVKSEALVSQKEKEWGSKEAKIHAAQVGCALTLIEEQRRLKEGQTDPHHVSVPKGNDCVARTSNTLAASRITGSPAAIPDQNAVQAAASCTVTDSESKNSPTGMPPNEEGDSSDEGDGLI